MRCVGCAALRLQPPAPITPLRRKRHLKGAGAGGDKARRLRSRHVRWLRCVLMRAAIAQEHAEFDPASLREHEEFTKVRNILKIELGRHEMDTWYFSPFPAEYNDCSKLYFCEVRTRCRLRERGGFPVLTLNAHARLCAVHARVFQAPRPAAAAPAQE